MTIQMEMRQILRKDLKEPQKSLELQKLFKKFRKNNFSMKWIQQTTKQTNFTRR